METQGEAVTDFLRGHDHMPLPSHVCFRQITRALVTSGDLERGRGKVREEELGAYDKLMCALGSGGRDGRLEGQ